MVADDKKYWFENGDNAEGGHSGTPQKPASENAEKDDLFSPDASAPLNTLPPDAGGYFVPSGQSEGNGGYFMPQPQNFQASSKGGQNANAPDPHERHYQSDFAKRSSVPEKDLNKSGNIKAMRGSMLKKLLKHDFRALAKFLIPCYLALAALSVVSFLLYMLAQSTSSVNTAIKAATAFWALLGLGVSAASVVSVIAVVSRFYKNLFSGEGYLTMSIPATAEEHLFSKLISAFTAMILTTIVTELAMLLAYAPTLGMEYYIQQSMFAQLFKACMDSNLPALAFVEMLLFGFFFQFFSIHLYFVCICLGQMVTSKNRIGAAIGFYFAFSFGFGIILSFFMVDFLFDMVLGEGDWINFFNSAGMHGLLWIGILVFAALDVGAFFLERFILKRKVNLA